MARARKQRFELMDNETIDECLERMKKSGYMPVGRVEKPIFKEVIEGNETQYVPVGRKIVFEGRLME